MKRKKYTRLILMLWVGVFLSFSFSELAQVESKEESYSDSVLQHKPVFPKYYSFINYTQNYLQWDESSRVRDFFKKLMLAHRKKVTMLHLGDSHVQADMFTGQIRQELQSLFGAGGRGLVFPFSIANTHTPVDYQSFHTGIWEYAKNTQLTPLMDLGMTGITAHTTDKTASFTIAFKPQKMSNEYTVVKLFCKQEVASFDVLLTYAYNKPPILVDCSVPTTNGYIEIHLPEATDTLTFQMHASHQGQVFFECYGLSLESAKNKGILYHSVGINGAGYKSILKQTLFATHLKAIKPDVVVIDLGANDFYKKPYLSFELQQNLERIVDYVYESVPDALVIISNSQAIEGVTYATMMEFAQLTQQVALSTQSAYYDYYRISGGPESNVYWYTNELMKEDRIHLKKLGYELKGNLVVNGLLNSFQAYKKNKEIGAFLIPDTLKYTIIEEPLSIKSPVDSLLDSTLLIPR